MEKAANKVKEIRVEGFEKRRFKLLDKLDPRRDNDLQNMGMVRPRIVQILLDGQEKSVLLPSQTVTGKWNLNHDKENKWTQAILVLQTEVEGEQREVHRVKKTICHETLRSVPQNEIGLLYNGRYSAKATKGVKNTYRNPFTKEEYIKVVDGSAETFEGHHDVIFAEAFEDPEGKLLRKPVGDKNTQRKHSGFYRFVKSLSYKEYLPERETGRLVYVEDGKFYYPTVTQQLYQSVDNDDLKVGFFIASIDRNRPLLTLDNLFFGSLDLEKMLTGGLEKGLYQFTSFGDEGTRRYEEWRRLGSDPSRFEIVSPYASFSIPGMGTLVPRSGLANTIETFMKEEISKSILHECGLIIDDYEGSVEGLRSLFKQRLVELDKTPTNSVGFVHYLEGLLSRENKDRLLSRLQGFLKNENDQFLQWSDFIQKSTRSKIEFLTRPPEVIDKGNTLTFRGPFLGMSDIWKHTQKTPSIKKDVQAIAGRKFFFDCNYVAPGKNFSAASPKAHISKNKMTIDLSGEAGSPGSDGSGHDPYRSNRGKDGYPGNPGGHSGHFAARFNEVKGSLEKLHFILNGGSGGKGGNGYPGIDGQVGEEKFDNPQHYRRVVRKDFYSMAAGKQINLAEGSTFYKDICFQEGSPGSPGTAGGNAAYGGKGGNAGEFDCPILEKVSILRKNGTDGQNGTPGKGGKGGKSGKTTILNKQLDIWDGFQIHFPGAYNALLRDFSDKFIPIIADDDFVKKLCKDHNIPFMTAYDSGSSGSLTVKFPVSTNSPNTLIDIDRVQQEIVSCAQVENIETFFGVFPSLIKKSKL